MKTKWFYIRSILQALWIILVLSGVVFVSAMMLKNKQDSGMGPLVIMGLLVAVFGAIEIAERFRKLENPNQ